MTNHRSIEDSQIASLEGQGLGPEDEILLSGYRLDGEQISLQVDKSVSSGFICYNFCSGEVGLLGSGLVVTANRLKRLDDQGSDNREAANLA